MKMRVITINRRIKYIDENGEEKFKKVQLYCRINNSIPPNHRMCERGRNW